MPYKDPEAKRRYKSRYYEQKIKTGAIPCTAYRKRSYGLTSVYANKTAVSESAIMASDSSGSRPIALSNAAPTSARSVPSLFPFRSERKKPAAPRSSGAEYTERIPKGFTSLGNGVVMRFIKLGKD